MDDLELDLSTEEQNINKTQERIQNLSGKVKEQAEAAEKARAAEQAANERANAAEKKAEFLDSFTGVATKYPGATEYKDAIQEKVLAGYSVEDAAVSVLNAEGKFIPVPPQVEVAPQTQAAGGSAPITISTSGSKELHEMSREEKRAEILKAVERGDISMT